jgi:Uma2 family endonuclease
MTLTDRPEVYHPVDYPESDGSLIAESDWHRHELFDLIYRLETRYAHDPDTYVSGHMLVYYEEGDPSAVFAPDVMVVFGVPKDERRVYKLWNEGRPPSVVFEVSSRKTWLDDVGNKRAMCERLGVAEYFLWDPRVEYLTPPLQGLRLFKRTYRAIRRDAAGCLSSTALDLRLCTEDGRLELYDRRTGERLCRPGEAESAARLALEEACRAREDALRATEVARQVLQVERTARERAEAAENAARVQAQAAEAEIARLRVEVARLRGGG